MLCWERKEEKHVGKWEEHGRKAEKEKKGWNVDISRNKRERGQVCVAMCLTDGRGAERGGESGRGGRAGGRAGPPQEQPLRAPQPLLSYSVHIPKWCNRCFTLLWSSARSLARVPQRRVPRTYTLTWCHCPLFWQEWSRALEGETNPPASLLHRKTK